MRSEIKTDKPTKIQQNPANYKTQDGLLKALEKLSQAEMDFNVAWWLQNAKFTLINKWGWDEQQASRYVAGYTPSESKYKATG